MRTAVGGDFRSDLESMNGQVVTVRGMKQPGSVRVQEFAPGKSEGFITGEVVDLTNCPPNAMCAPKIGIRRGNGDVVELGLEKSMEMSGMVGATVTMRGSWRIEPASVRAMLKGKDIRMCRPPRNARGVGSNIFAQKLLPRHGTSCFQNWWR